MSRIFLSGVQGYVHWSGLKGELASNREDALLEFSSLRSTKSPFEFCITETMIMYDIMNGFQFEFCMTEIMMAY